jgi:hypothetical protein
VAEAAPFDCTQPILRAWPSGALMTVAVVLIWPLVDDAHRLRLSFDKTSSDSLRIRDLCTKSLEPG